MTPERGVPIKVKVEDKRHTATAAESAPVEDAAAQDVAEEQHILETETQHDYLADLQRLQAEFDNYRKRMMKEQAAAAARAGARIVESLLPVLDNFERAISHGEGGAGVELVFKELRSVLERDGLQEIAAEGAAFDPQIHEAVESHDDPDVDQPVVRTVYRRGYRFKDQLLRPAMVVVARPADPADDSGAGNTDDTTQEKG
ncbi:MAG: nucleotide exchange factor GrpE [Actinomycetota bacterium]|nr:nucleotide exchange factor GrpE [Actinomycetota bacterium]